jgi:hypothetical protein
LGYVLPTYKQHPAWCGTRHSLALLTVDQLSVRFACSVAVAQQVADSNLSNAKENTHLAGFGQMMYAPGLTIIDDDN